MEKPAAPKSKNKIMRFLPRATSAVTFQNPPFSPGREKQRASAYAGTGGRGFSGPIISIIPAEARRNSKKKESYDAQEPTSPKISCMGQIKHKKKLHKSRELANKPKISSSSSSKSNSSSKEIKKQKSSIRNIFRGAKLPGRKSDSSLADKPPLPNKAPSLSQVKRFASGRDTFANFDWTAQIAPVDSDHRNYYSDEERRDSEEEEEEEEDIIIPFSAPMMVGGGGISLEPRKEINLWKRRTMAPPARLQLKSVVKKSY